MLPQGVVAERAALVIGSHIGDSSRNDDCVQTERTINALLFIKGLMLVILSRAFFQVSASAMAVAVRARVYVVYVRERGGSSSRLITSDPTPLPGPPIPSQCHYGIPMFFALANRMESYFETLSPNDKAIVNSMAKAYSMHAAEEGFPVVYQPRHLALGFVRAVAHQRAETEMDMDMGMERGGSLECDPMLHDGCGSAAQGARDLLADARVSAAAHLPLDQDDALRSSVPFASALSVGGLAPVASGPYSDVSGAGISLLYRDSTMYVRAPPRGATLA
jgi:hypothetical protein